MNFPQTKKIPHSITLHGDTRTDNYFWLHEKDNPTVLQYLEAENAFTQNYMSDTKGLQDELYHEMLARIQEDDTSAPFRDGSFFYESQTFAGKQYPVYTRTPINDQNSKTVLLDLNAIAKNHSYLSCGFIEVSPDENLLAFSLDTNGSEIYTLFIKNLQTQTELPIQIHNVVSFAWANDNHTFFYTIRDESLREYRVYRHEIGLNKPDGQDDVLIYEEKDVGFSVSVEHEKTRTYIFLHCRAGNSSEVYFLSAEKPKELPQIIAPRTKEHEYAVWYHENYFYILTNENQGQKAINFRLVKTATQTPEQKNWQEVIAHDSSVTLRELEILQNHICVLQRKNGLDQLVILDPKTLTQTTINQPEPSYSLKFGTNRIYATNILRYDYTSLTTPATTIDVDLNSQQKTIIKTQPVLGGYSPDEFVSERIWATANDGVKIPISLVYKKTLSRAKAQPLYLTGYGSYGISYDVYFSSPRLSLLNRGVIFAIAHIRGGSDLGEIWRSDGKMLKKKNTFTDFVTCAEHLITQNYTSTSKLVIQGGSAGGLLMGAVTNLAPQMFRAVIADVPFVDCLNTMLDDTLPLTTGEYVEWGNPNEKIYYDYMKSYCPYTNVSTKPYPMILAKAGLNDPRVSYWEAAKWVAKLREHTTSQNPILLKTNMGAGHGGSSGRYDKLKEIAFDYAFVLKAVA